MPFHSARASHRFPLSRFYFCTKLQRQIDMYRFNRLGPTRGLTRKNMGFQWLSRRQWRLAAGVCGLAIAASAPMGAQDAQQSGPSTLEVASAYL